jgi:hypothetical protein
MQAFLFRFDQTGCSKRLEVLRGIGKGQAGFAGQGFNVFFALTKQVQLLQALRTGYRFADS